MPSMTALTLCLRVILSEREWWIDLPELTSIRMIDTALYFNEDDNTNELIMRSGGDEMKWRIDLPKLKSLTTEGEDPISFKGVYYVILEGISCCSILTNRHALSHYCSSSSCIPGVSSVVLQQYSQSERMMHRHWWIGKSSQHSQAQSRCKHSFHWWACVYGKECGGDDCGQQRV